MNFVSLERVNYFKAKEVREHDLLLLDCPAPLACQSFFQPEHGFISLESSSSRIE